MLENILEALYETVYLTFIPLAFSVVLGSVVGVIIFITSRSSHVLTSTNGPLYVINRIMDALVNILRSIPYLILIIWMTPVTRFLTGSVIGTKAAVPALVASATPFFARMVVIAFSEVDKGVIEAAKALGADTKDIIFHVLIPESKPALISSMALTAINLVSYSAMAGAIGAGGLGYEAYQYGLVRRNEVLMLVSTSLIVVIVFAIQIVGDKLARSTDKR